jgi:hypothetical protein
MTAGPRLTHIGSIQYKQNQFKYTFQFPTIIQILLTIMSAANLLPTCTCTRMLLHQKFLHHLHKYKHLAFDNSYITMFMLNCWLLYLWLTWSINWHLMRQRTLPLMMAWFEKHVLCNQVLWSLVSLFSTERKSCTHVPSRCYTVACARTFSMEPLGYSFPSPYLGHFSRLSW